jgi:hypothetical protein
VRDAVAAQQSGLDRAAERLGRKALELRELEPTVDPTQLAFELNAVLVAANTPSFFRDPGFERARAAVRGRLPGLSG